MPIKQLFGKKILVTLERPVVAEKKSKFETSAKPEEVKPTTAIVAFVGDEVPENKIKVGDRIFIGSFYPQETEIDGEKYVMIKTDDLIAQI